MASVPSIDTSTPPPDPSETVQALNAGRDQQTAEKLYWPAEKRLIQGIKLTPDKIERGLAANNVDAAMAFGHAGTNALRQAALAKDSGLAVSGSGQQYGALGEAMAASRAGTRTDATLREKSGLLKMVATGRKLASDQQVGWQNLGQTATRGSLAKLASDLQNQRLQTEKNIGLTNTIGSTVGTAIGLGAGGLSQAWGPTGEGSFSWSNFGRGLAGKEAI